MADDHTKLLTEIRDTSREHLELYKVALAAQKMAIESQQKAIAQQKVAMRLGMALILAILLVGYLGLSGAIETAIEKAAQQANIPRFVPKAENPAN